MEVRACPCGVGQQLCDVPSSLVTITLPTSLPELVSAGMMISEDPLVFVYSFSLVKREDKPGISALLPGAVSCV